MKNKLLQALISGAKHLQKRQQPYKMQFPVLRGSPKSNQELLGKDGGT